MQPRFLLRHSTWTERNGGSGPPAVPTLAWPPARRQPLTPPPSGLQVRTRMTLPPDWLVCSDFRASVKGQFVNRNSGRRLASPPGCSPFYPNAGSEKQGPSLAALLALDCCPSPRHSGGGGFHPQTQALLFHPSAAALPCICGLVEVFLGLSVPQVS